MRHSELESGIVNPAIYNLGSVNIDLSYSIDHIVASGGTAARTAARKIPQPPVPFNPFNRLTV